MVINPDTLEIEIVDIEPIDGGVQVFARAWSDGVQIGFGVDGTVDIERFRIINPPILVPDENGDITLYATQAELDRDEFGLVIPFRKMREDAEAALLTNLADTIKAIAKHDASNIVVGKIGNTTTTVNSSSSAEDGQVGAGRNTWASVRAATVGANVDDTGTQPRAQSGNTDLSTGWENIRAFVAFDTSSIPDGDTISSATLSLRGTNKIDQANKAACLVSASPASATALALEDYDQVGSTELATRIDITAWSTTAYNDYALNASGLANISKTGISYFAVRTSTDFDDDISGFAINQNSTVLFYANEFTGTADDPKLVIEHAGAGGTPTPLLMLMGMGT